MATLSPVIGAHAFIGGFDGETVDGATVDADNPPDETPASNWRSMGCIEQAEWTRTFEGQSDLLCPSPGSYQLKNRIYTSTTLTITLGIAEPNVDFWQIAFGAPSLSAGVFSPDGEGQPKKGWVKIQHYTSGDETNQFNFQLWCSMQVDGAFTFSSQRTQPGLQLTVLNNLLNSGALLNDALTASP